MKHSPRLPASLVMAALAAALPAALLGCGARKADTAADQQAKARLAVESRIQTIQNSPMPPQVKEQMIAKLRAQSQAPGPAKP